MSTGFLSNDYLAKLMADTSPDSSSETAAKIAAVSERGASSDKERGPAKETGHTRFTLLINEG